MGPHRSLIFAATLTLLFAASMQAQMQVDRTQNVRGVPQVAHGNVSAAARDRAVSSDSTGQAGVYRDKPSIDLRDWGVDCTGTNDATSIVNSYTNVQDNIEGQHILIPAGCIVSLQSGQWQIYGNEGWVLEGAGGPLANRPSIIKYCGSGGPDSTLKIERSGGWTVRGLMIQSGGCGAGTTANGVIVDNDRSGGYTTTDGLFDRVEINASVNTPNWIGLALGIISGVNVEDIRMVNSIVGCANSSNGTGIATGVGSFNTKLEEFHHNNIVQCPSAGLSQANGGFFLEGMDAYGNTPDIQLSSGSDPTYIQDVVSESPYIFNAGYGDNYPATMVASHEGWAGSLSAGYCGLDLHNVGGGDYLFIGDGIDTPPTTTSFPVCAGTNGHLMFIGSTMYSEGLGLGGGNGTVASGPTFVLPSGHNFGGDYSVFRGGRLRMGHAANYGNEDIGYGFFTQYGAELAGYSFNAQSTDDGHLPGMLSIGNDVMYLGNQNITLKGMWPINGRSVTCTYTGTAGSTQWIVNVYPKDAAGNRGGTLSVFRNCPGTGASTLTGSNYLTAVWPRVTGAVSYDVVISNYTNINIGLLAANVADPGSGQTATTTITSGSTRSIFNYSFPNYYDSAITTINGESLIVNAPSKFTSAVTLPALTLATTYISGTAPAIFSGFGASPSIVHSNGTAVFTINVGTGGTATSGVIGLPRAMNGWAVHCDDITTQSTSVFVTKQTATSATSATLTQYSAAAVATPWAASDVLVCQAAAY